MKLLTDRFDELSSVGERACFSILHTETHYRELPVRPLDTHTGSALRRRWRTSEETQAA